MKEILTNFTDKELERLRESFFQQAFEIIEDLQTEMLRFENNPDDLEALKNIQRHVHTLKGDSASMGLDNLSDTAHRLEDILHMLREKRLQMDRGVADLLLSSVDVFSQILTNSKEERTFIVETKGIIERIDNYLKTTPTGQTTEGTKENVGTGRSVPLTEYQQLQVETALKNGLLVYEIEITFNPQCKERSIGAFMINRQLSTIGEIICWIPDIEDAEIEKADTIRTVIITQSDKEILEKCCKIAGIANNVNISPISLVRANGRSPLQNQRKTDVGAGLKPAPTVPAYHDTTLRVDAKRIDEVMNLVGELIIGRSMITQSVYELKERLGKDETVSNLENINSLFERSLSELQKGIMKVRMVPIDHVFRKFPRVVRDLSIEKGKEVKLEICGAHTELDKGIVDVIGEPLIHILRNSIDHGIELPVKREKKGKDRCGVIKINAYHEGGQIIIEVEDDGKGIDTKRLREKAIERGIISKEESNNMSDEKAIDLIFHSGLSTAEVVTETSGRGIGMDVVRKTVEDLKGLIQVSSITDVGTRFIIRLPLTLAIIQGMIFKNGDRFFAFPLSSVLEIRRVFRDEISTINGLESLKWRDRIISLTRLREVINQNTAEERLLRFARNDKQVASNDIQYGHCEEQSDEAISEGKNKFFVLVIGLAEKRLGILVDKLIGKRELVIKAIDNGSDVISGASILGNGGIVLVLDGASLIKKTVSVN